MAEQDGTATEGTEEEGTSTEEGASTDEGTEGAGNDGSNGDEGSDSDVPADVLRANLTKANQEAARYRTRLREVEKELEKRKTPEEVESLLGELKSERETAERSLLIENVALKHHLPEDLAALLKGETREELDAHALVLAKYAPKPEGDDEVPPGDLDGGLNPGSGNSGDALSARERVRQIKGYR